MSTHDLVLLLGRLLERSEATVDRLDRIDQRLDAGTSHMTQISQRISRLERAQPGESMPALERWIKSLLPYLIGAATLLATGSAEQAAKAVAALTGR